MLNTAENTFEKACFLARKFTYSENNITFICVFINNSRVKIRNA